MTGANVQSLFAEIEPTSGADLDVVELLKELLDRAEQGELVGIAYATVGRTENWQSCGWDGAASTRHPLSSAIMMLQHRYAVGLMGGDE